MTAKSTATITSKPARTRSVTGRLQTLGAVDQRTVAAKRVNELATGFIAEVSMDGAFEVSERERQLIRRAAMLGVLLEDLEAQLMAGEADKRALYVTTTNAQRRVLSALNIGDDED